MLLWHILKRIDKNEAIKKELKFRYGYLDFSKAEKIKKIFENYKTSKFGDFLVDYILKRE